MRWEDLGKQNCSVARSLSVFGDRWTLMILRDCFMGVRRFDDFLENLDLSRTILSDRLAKLVTHDVLAKIPYQEKPTRYDYKLTEKGLALYPVILAIVDWGDAFYSEGGEPPVLRTHLKCGHDFSGVVTCSECHEPVTPQEVKIHANPNCAKSGEFADAKEG